MKNPTDNSNQNKPSVADRLEMVKRFRRSGRTRRAFCDSEGVAKSTLDWWLRKAKAVSRTKKRSRKMRVAFREVALVSSRTETAAGWSMEIVSARGLTIRSRQMLSLEEMMRLLREPRC
jgi:hypothetical protein